MILWVWEYSIVYVSTHKLYLDILKKWPPGQEEGVCGNKIREGRGAERRSSDGSSTLRVRKGAIYTSGYPIRIKLNTV